jgi:hypothetical protein
MSTCSWRLTVCKVGTVISSTNQVILSTNQPSYKRGPRRIRILLSINQPRQPGS